KLFRIFTLNKHWLFVAQKRVRVQSRGIVAFISGSGTERNLGIDVYPAIQLDQDVFGRAICPSKKRQISTAGDTRDGVRIGITSGYSPGDIVGVEIWITVR